MTQKETRCVLCWDAPTEPQQLACGHLCCRDCAKKQLEYQMVLFMGRGYTANEARLLCEPLMVSCAACGRATAMAELEKDVGQGAEWLRRVATERRAAQCSIAGCASKVCCRCVDCSADERRPVLFCEDHQAEHDMEYEHEYDEDIGGGEEGAEGAAAGEELCEKHQLPFVAVCRKCMDVKICEKCYQRGGTHYYHAKGNVVRFGVPEDCKDQYHSILGSLKIVLDELNSYTADASRINFDRVALDIERKFDDLMKALEKEKESVLARLVQIREQDDKLREGRTSCISVLRAECARRRQEIDAVAAKRPCSEIHAYLDEVQDSIAATQECFRRVCEQQYKPEITFGTCLKTEVVGVAQGFTKDMYVQVRDDFNSVTVEESTIPAISGYVNGSAAVYIPSQDEVYESSYSCSKGQDVRLTSLNTRTQTRLTYKMTVFNRPAFDGDEYIYIKEYTGSRTGQCKRLNVKTRVLEGLPSLPKTFNTAGRNFFNCGYYYGFDELNNVWRLNSENLAAGWEDCKQVCESVGWGVAFAQHPWDQTRMIMYDNGTVREIRPNDWVVLREYSSAFKHPSKGFADCIAVRAQDGNYFLFTQTKNKWSVFSSKDDKWTDLNWPCPNEVTENAFFCEKRHAIFYYDGNGTTWKCAPLPQ